MSALHIVMLTNTFTPHVGGVARSVSAFANEFRRQGHRVLVVAPEFEDAPQLERDVVRVPAIQHFNGTDFSVPVPVPGILTPVLDDFAPDVVHTHHPFLLGDTALRIAAGRDIPVVFTHHTRYEQYTHYVPGDSPTLQRFVVELATGFANLCDAVIAPSETIHKLLLEDGVETPVHVIPTGIDVERLARGDGSRMRAQCDIPADAFVVGHVGRLAPEKNLTFLIEAAAAFLQNHPQAHLLFAGVGPSLDHMQRVVDTAGLTGRFHHLGILQAQELVDAYHAMDVFAFASQSETQGLVIAEAMAAGVPVVAVDASGVREVLRDGHNGRMLAEEDLDAFTAALEEVCGLKVEQRSKLSEAALKTAEQFAMSRCAAQAIALYESLIDARASKKTIDDSPWDQARRAIRREWEIWQNVAEAVRDSRKESGP